MGLYIYSFIVTVFLIVAVTFLLHNRIERKEKAVIEQKYLEVMSTQIKPHFIYNILNTIWYLCEKDTKKAQKAIEEFSEYLRGNLDSLNMDDTVPFTQELSHIENYLELEKLRFGDELEVVYDIGTDNFRLPALSVQPLVENAVKHGIRVSEEGGRVVISTRETPKAYEISVFDNGGGYNPHYRTGDKDGRTHVGLSNTRERLKMMCGGTLNISSRDGEGTRVTIKIPKENKKRKRK
ncbi:MAG: histidine kinase [Lachnospiraceae bacterium]|nr:histidine kinase [Lachnospiraceae bacterium]